MTDTVVNPAKTLPLTDLSTLPSHAFTPAFQLKCEAKIKSMNQLFDDMECLQRRQILLSDTNVSLLPGPPRDRAWRWRTLDQFRLNNDPELEYQDSKRKKDWRKVVPASEVYKTVTQIHCRLSHVGQDKTEAWISARLKGIPRAAVRMTVGGCQACQKR